jgi:hypothetical protein
MGKDDLKWVANTTTLIYGEQGALLVDTFLSDAQTAELADWIAATGMRLSTVETPDTPGHDTLVPDLRSVGTTLSRSNL